MDELETLKKQKHILMVVVACQLKHMKDMHTTIVSLLDGEGPDDPAEVAFAKAALSPIPLAVDMALAKFAKKGIVPTDNPPSIADFD